MAKVLNVQQIRAADQYTIQHEPISSLELMERASETFVRWFRRKFSPKDRQILVFCGPGNNGGDGLVIARYLSQEQFTVKVFHADPILNRTSNEFQINLAKVKASSSIECQQLASNFFLSERPNDFIAIDAMFGTGLSRPLEGIWPDAIDRLNKSGGLIVSVDIPSGLFADQQSTGVAINADYTISFQVPKLAFFLAENAPLVGDWTVIPIGLHPDFLNAVSTDYFTLENTDIKPLIRKREKHDHKGKFGHALLMVGSYGKMGAGVLASKGCLRSGVGLLSVYVPKSGYHILQSTVPEAMIIVDPDEHELTQIPDLSPYRAIGVGCGIGQNPYTREMLHSCLDKAVGPLVLDADALNILGQNPSWMQKIPPNSILTPHPKEFERLFGKTVDDFERLDCLRKNAINHKIIIVLKGAFTAIASPDGSIFFNTTGNPGMGTAGSGDVLTGILTGLLAQGYPPLDAAKVGVYLHGLAGDLAASDLSEPALLSGDLPTYLSKAYLELQKI